MTIRSALVLAGTAVALALGPGAASGATCPEVNPAYTGPCGPTFVLPGWGDAGGWSDPEQYETIQLADIDGDGAEELMARTPTGIMFHWFDTSVGQWRPVVDDQDVPLALTDFADPAPLGPQNPPGPSGHPWNVGQYPPRTDWTLPQYYDTILAADVDGKPGEEVVGRSARGLLTFKFTSAGRGTGKWQTLPDPDESFSVGLDDPSQYSTLQAGDIDGDHDKEIFARQKDGVVAVDWIGGSRPWKVLPKLKALADDDSHPGQSGNQPAYYTSLQAANVAGDDREEVIARDAGGVAVYRYLDGAWSQISATHPFSDVKQQSDCPMTLDSASCLGAGPAYYGTLALANVDGSGQADLVARTPDGLRTYFYQDGRFQRATATLGDLSDANGWTKESYYSTLQFADIDNNGSAEALARDKDGLQAWSFDGAAWSKLAPKTALALADDPWGGDRSYYSTIETGDVDGDGRADVIARGPYGIRTWFYDRNGSGGWGSYLPAGYPDFDTPGRKEAYTRLNKLAGDKGHLTGAQNTIRDLWTAVQEPTTDFQHVLDTLPREAGCSTTVSASHRPTPPQYPKASCTPPSDAKGFTADDWTSVINEIVAELWYAANVHDHFYNSADGVTFAWHNLFEQQLAQLDATGTKLGLQAAAESREAYDSKELMSGILGIGGAIAGLAPEGEPLAAVFEIASEVMSMIPSASESLTEEFDSKLSDLKTELASNNSQTVQVIAAQSQIIRQDQGLLTLIGQLRARGTWKLDPLGMLSYGQQGFAAWLYKTLLPTIYTRYSITSCIARTEPADDCQQPANSRAEVGNPGVKDQGSPSFHLIGPPPTASGWSWPTPCYRPIGAVCKYQPVDDKLAELVWGPMSPSCTYDGTTSNAAWVFGTCSAGIDPARSVVPSSIASRNWDFPTLSGDFWVCLGPAGKDPPPCPGPAGSTRGAARVAPAFGPALRLTGTIGVPRSFRMRGASVEIKRLLHESDGAGELAAGRPRPRLALAAASPRSRTFTSARRSGRTVRLKLRRRSRRSLAFDLRVRGRRLALPDACRGTRRGVDIADAALYLHTRLRIRERRGRSHTVSLRPAWHCRRNRIGAVHRLVVRQPKVRAPRRGGLRVAIRGPRRAVPGRLATYRITVRNPASTPAYDVLVNAVLPRGLEARRSGRQVTRRYARLRPHASKTLRLRARVASSAAGTKRLRVGAQAIDTRAAGARRTIRIRQ